MILKFSFGTICFLIFFQTFSQKETFEIPEAFGKSKYGFYSPDGYKLIAYSSGGLYLKIGNKWAPVNSFLEGQLSSNHVRCLAKDKQGNLWLGFGNNSIQQIKGGKVLNFQPKTEDDQLLVRGSVNQMIALDEHMLLASDYGMFLLDLEMRVEQKFSFVEAFPNVVHSFNTSDLMRCAIADKQSPNIFWIGGTMGLSSIDIQTGTWTHYPMTKEQIEQALEPKFSIKEYNNLMITDLLRIEDRIYCATWGNGIMVYDIIKKKWQSYHFQKITPLVPLDENIVSRLCQINDSILVATTQGFKSPKVFDFKNLNFLDFKH